MKSGSFILLTLLYLLIEGCESSSSIPTAPPSGDWKLTITISVRDEFYRYQPPVGPFEISLTAQDRALHHVVPNGDSVFIIDNVPYQTYLVTVNKKGYFQSNNAAGYSYYYKSIEAGNVLYPLPSPSTKIDSISYQLNTVIPQVRFTFYPAQTVPGDGRRYVVFFAGLTPDVSTEFGSYVFSDDYIEQYPGASTIVTNDLYREIHAAGIPIGSKVYVTARIMTGATKTSLDEKTGLTVYSNLENNTRAVTSFIMP